MSLEATRKLTTKRELELETATIRTTTQLIKYIIIFHQLDFFAFSAVLSGSMKSAESLCWWMIKLKTAVFAAKNKMLAIHS